MEIRETKDLRSLNKIKIIESILLKKQISRADLSTLTGLNKATVSIIVKDLLDLNLIQESTIGDSTGGRKPIMLAIKDDIGYMIAIDLNVNTIDVIVTDLSCKILSSYNILIKNKSFEDAFNDLCALLERIISSTPKCQYNLIGISISVRGVIDLDEVIRFIPELGWRDIDIKSKLVEKFDVPVYIENDGNLSAMAEHELLPNQKDLIVVTIDDVITSGIIANGNLVKGYLGFANAIGHHVIDYDGKKCTCGKQGCLEQYCSNLAVLAHVNKKIHIPDIETFVDLVKRKNSYALETLDYFINHLSIGLTNLIFILNPEMIVVNSYILNKLPNAVKTLQDKIFLPITRYQDLCVSTLGKKAPLMGACSVCLNQFYKNLLIT